MELFRAVRFSRLSPKENRYVMYGSLVGTSRNRHAVYDHSVEQAGTDLCCMAQTLVGDRLIELLTS